MLSPSDHGVQDVEPQHEAENPNEATVWHGSDDSRETFESADLDAWRLSGRFVIADRMPAMKISIGRKSI